MARRISPESLLQCSQCLRHQTNSIRGVRHYNVSKLSPIQPPPETSPASPLFVPRKMGHTTRLSTYYDEIIAPNFLLMSYDPKAKPERQLLPLRWDGTSPYHKNRPQPRVNPLPKLRQPINAGNLPEIQSITVHTMVKSSIQQRPDLLHSALAIQSITGQRPEFIDSYNSVAVFKLRPSKDPDNGVNLRNSNCCTFGVKRTCDVEFPIYLGRGRLTPSQRFRGNPFRTK